LHARRRPAGGAAQDVPHEPLLQPAALEVGLEVLRDIARQRPAGLGAQLAERRIRLLDEVVTAASTRAGGGHSWADRERRARGRRARAATDMRVSGNGRGRNRLCGDAPRQATQVCTFRADIPVGAPAACGTRALAGRTRKRPGSRLPGPFASSRKVARPYMPMSPMPPMSGMPPCLCSSSFGDSATITSVVSSSPATEAAFCSARRVTLVGSRMPISSMSP
jgi:hypothetical protein